ncbi:hypothetical protein ACO22_06760 [Paracoccidioides brasiliensis]|uniref:BZIP domain-containing protein n=1 Tax=Paracoccidioides brasiliensis TaxID=121759 RepID=A0A1D2J6Z3_PARBR|nr:hypothetical protein ACO22_06760 [Paracoccidioides brasiliensis]
MDYRFMSLSPHSPEIPHPFFGEPAESPSDSSSPVFPNGMEATMYTDIESSYGRVPFDDGSSPHQDPIAGKIPLEYIGSTTLDEHDRIRRRRNNGREREIVTNMHLRRRAQNRASQRAFRERKEQHLKSLESRLHDLSSKYHDLLQSYARQAEAVQHLIDRIQQLTTELELLRSTNDGTMGEMSPQYKFDIIAYPESCPSPEYHYNKSAGKLNNEQLTYGPHNVFP